MTLVASVGVEASPTVTTSLVSIGRRYSDSLSSLQRMFWLLGVADDTSQRDRAAAL